MHWLEWTIHIRFCTRRECWIFHTDIGSAIVDSKFSRQSLPKHRYFSATSCAIFRAYKYWQFSANWVSKLMCATIPSWKKVDGRSLFYRWTDRSPPYLRSDLFLPMIQPRRSIGSSLLQRFRQGCSRDRGLMGWMMVLPVTCQKSSASTPSFCTFDRGWRAA